ncbi:MAG: Xaa-Pro peptidase family protein [archaeon]
MKLKEFQTSLAEKNIDAGLFLSADPSFFYFVGQKIDDSMVIIPANGKPMLFVNNLEHVKVKIKKIIYQNPYKDLKTIFSIKKIKSLGINEGSVSIKQKKELSKIVRIKSLGNIVGELRSIKEKEEISRIKRACFLTEKVLRKIVKNFNFKTEEQIKKFIKIEAVKMDCGLSFEPIVASGKNGTKPHYSGNGRIKKGFLIIDVGLKYKGYCADITRTLYVGKPSRKELQNYNELLEIQKMAVAKVKADVKVKYLEDFVRKKMGKNEKYFVHSLGHGLGINVHESPTVSSKSGALLKENMVITIEPGIYGKYGIRIEDDVLVTANGGRVLSKFPKELIIISRKP